MVRSGSSLFAYRMLYENVIENKKIPPNKIKIGNVPIQMIRSANVIEIK